jgi:hypothetical protein
VHFRQHFRRALHSRRGMHSRRAMHTRPCMACALPASASTGLAWCA